jgi:hypothetical protein
LPSQQLFHFRNGHQNGGTLHEIYRCDDDADMCVQVLQVHVLQCKHIHRSDSRTRLSSNAKFLTFFFFHEEDAGCFLR